MSRIRNETYQHSAALKSAGQNPVSLLPLFHARLLRRRSSCASFLRRLEASAAEWRDVAFRRLREQKLGQSQKLVSNSGP